MDKKTAEASDLSKFRLASPDRSFQGFQGLMSAIEQSKIEVADLSAAGGERGAPVRRVEANVLFEIDAAAAERTDDGRFGNLLVKSVAHCVLAEAGQRVPPRQVAVAPATELSWANRSADTDIDTEILVWIASHVRNKKRLKSTLMGISAFLTGIGATLSLAAPSITTVVDRIA
jgi:hypothetical protein